MIFFCKALKLGALASCKSQSCLLSSVERQCEFPLSEQLHQGEWIYLFFLSPSYTHIYFRAITCSHFSFDLVDMTYTRTRI